MAHAMSYHPINVRAWTSPGLDSLLRPVGDAPFKTRAGMQNTQIASVTLGSIIRKQHNDL